MRLTDIVVQNAIIPRLASTGRDEVIEEMTTALVAAGALPKKLYDEIVKLILKREKKGSTGFPHGVAVPHAKHPDLSRINLAIGVSEPGIDFNALDKKPTHMIFLLLSPESRPDDHIDAMKAIFDNLQQERFRSFLRQAATTADVVNLLEEADAKAMIR
jgi:mannitol/fructose-specific phosphotransferase system IIA component (Ntr-type)